MGRISASSDSGAEDPMVHIPLPTFQHLATGNESASGNELVVDVGSSPLTFQQPSIVEKAQACFKFGQCGDKAYNMQLLAIRRYSPSRSSTVDSSARSTSTGDLLPIPSERTDEDDLPPSELRQPVLATPRKNPGALGNNRVTQKNTIQAPRIRVRRVSSEERWWKPYVLIFGLFVASQWGTYSCPSHDVDSVVGLVSLLRSHKEGRACLYLQLFPFRHSDGFRFLRADSPCCGGFVNAQVRTQ